MWNGDQATKSLVQHALQAASYDAVEPSRLSFFFIVGLCFSQDDASHKSTSILGQLLDSVLIMG